MTIYELLQQKKQELLQAGDPRSLTFSADEINLLRDKSQLRLLKISHTFCANFVPAKTLEECSFKLLDDQSGNDTYRLLELCMLANPAIRKEVISVFKEFGNE